MICNSGTAFRARVDGRRLFFEERGIYNGVFVMEDQQTHSLWSHYTGEAFDGPLKGKVLRWLRLERAAVSGVVAAHPLATVPRRGLLYFRRTPPLTDRQKWMGDQLPPNFAGTLPSGPAGVGLHRRGLGVAVGRAHRFYALDELFDQAVINEVIAGVPVVVAVQDGDATAVAFSRCVAGKTLRFSAVTYQGAAALRDAETGSTWSAAGLALAGPLAGAQLSSLRALVTDWYGWAAYFPATTSYGPPRAR